MAGYLEISDQIARRVANGDLAPGSELPSVRVFAAAEGVTPSTIARAYQRLAAADVVHMGDRRRTLRLRRTAPATLLRCSQTTAHFD